MSTTATIRRTTLNETMRQAGGKMVDFHGWELPIEFSGILKEHEAVRKSGKTEVYKLTPEERMAFKKVLVHVHKKMESRIGADLIKSIYQATDFDPSKL